AGQQAHEAHFRFAGELAVQRIDSSGIRQLERETAEDLLPSALRAFRGGEKFRFELVREDQLATGAAWLDLDRHAIEVRRKPRQTEREHEATRPRDFEIFAGVLDVLAVAAI